jgi:hypothetical protein
MTNETIVLDPPEFPQNPVRVALGLDELGISVMKSEWGDSEHELFLVKQERGEIPADRHPPNRTVTIVLKAEDEGAVSLAEAAQKLQQKVGRFQEEGGWVKRVLDEDGKYLTDVGMIVHTAVLGGLHGWQMAHRSIAPEITLTLTTGPYCYGTKEIETATFVEEVNRQLIYTVPNYLGTAPGIKRVIVKNIGGVNWLGLIGAFESRDLSEGPTAEPHYTGSQLTTLGKSTYSGSSIFRSGLTKSWLSFAYSKLKTGEHMTHLGGRRMFFRVEAAEKVEIRLEWRSLGSPYWSVNEPISLPSGLSIIDVGAAKPETATLGKQKWEWRLAVNKGEGEGTNIFLRDVWLFPAESFNIASYTPRFITPVEIKSEDNFTTGTEAALNGQALSDGTGNWVVTGSAAKPDWTKQLLGQIHRTEKEDSGTKIGTPPGGPYSIIAASCQVFISALPLANSVFPNLVFTGMGWGGKAFGPYIERWWQNEITKPEEINDHILFFNRFYYPLSRYFSFATYYTLTMIIVGNNYAVGWLRPTSNTTLLGTPDFISPLAGTAEGKVEIWDQGDFGAAYTSDRYIANFKVWVPDVDAITYASRKIELRSDGVFRQGETEDVWARLIADGFLPTAAPSGLEARPTRGIILPTQGNFGQMNDAGTPKLEVVEKYFPGYHFTSEAA